MAHPLQRLRAVRQLVDAGLDCGVLMAPIVPGFSTQPSKIERTIKAIADSGARSVGAMVMHLEGGTRDHFMGVLAREYPHLVDRYEHLYAGKYARKDYTKQVRRGGVADAREVLRCSDACKEAICADRSGRGSALRGAARQVSE